MTELTKNVGANATESNPGDEEEREDEGEETVQNTSRWCAENAASDHGNPFSY